MQFTKAERKKAKLRLGLTGASGSGKTYSALCVAKGLGGKIAVVDTEHGSASLYANDFEFDTLELTAPYSPERYIEAIESAEKAGYDVLVIDSITHEWNGKGGCLEINDNLATQHFRGNTRSAWSKTTPRHQSFIEKIISSKLHIIATMRSKTETVQANGNVKKFGMKSEQRDGIEYEFTTILDINHESHCATASKDRTKLFTGIDPFQINPEVGKAMMKWLNTGADFYMSQENQVILNDLLKQLPEDSVAYANVKKSCNSFAEVENSKFEVTRDWLKKHIAVHKQNQDFTPETQDTAQAEKPQLDTATQLVSEITKLINATTLVDADLTSKALYDSKAEIGEVTFAMLDEVLGKKINDLKDEAEAESGFCSSV